MNSRKVCARELTRREVLLRSGWGLGWVALTSLMADRVSSAVEDKPTTTIVPHFAPKVKNVIFLAQIGAPSQLDLFDYKPELAKWDGKAVPSSYLKDEKFAFIEAGKTQLLASPWKFGRYGQSGTWLSELLPYHRAIVDDLTWVHTLHTQEINHVPAQMFLQSGSPRMGRPTMGAWVTYGLGTENQNLPGFIVLSSGKAGRCGGSCWGSGFLPSVYQGVHFRATGKDPIHFLENPPGIDVSLRKATLETLTELNQQTLQQYHDPETRTRINAYEMAFRMQSSVPDLMDLAGESPSMLKLYGVNTDEPSFSRNCLLARRLVEKGVRYVQLIHGGWDHHGGQGDQNLLTGLPERTRQVDQGAAALIQDLRERGLLKETLVIFAGEFGRTPMLQGPRSDRELGRDHQRTAFTIWLAGGGLKPGHFGQTDDFGLWPVAEKFHVHDLQATILHLLGLDHKRLTYKYQGRQFRLTDVHGTLMRSILNT